MLNKSERYSFTISIKSEVYEFESDPLSAFELTNNYEGDLYLNGVLIFSPLKMSRNQNALQIEECLDIAGVKKTMGSWAYNLGYKHKTDPKILNFKKLELATALKGC